MILQALGVDSSGDGMGRPAGILLCARPAGAARPGASRCGAAALPRQIFIILTSSTIVIAKLDQRQTLFHIARVTCLWVFSC